MITLTPRSARESVPSIRTGGSALEEYRSLVHWLRTMGEMSGTATRSIGVTSCAPRAGVSTVASNLAAAAASSCEQPVLLLNLVSTRQTRERRPADSAELTLRDALENVSSLPREHVTASAIANLSLLTLTEADDPLALKADCDKFNELLRELDGEFGMVVVDLPPVDTSLCFITAGMLSGVLLVFEAERTRSDVAARAKQRLIDARASVFGVILNKNTRHIPAWLDVRL
jgi:Mrp family chromosome partitioning ATPase